MRCGCAQGGRSSLAPVRHSQSLADQGIVAFQACTFVEPAGSWLVTAAPFEPVGGVGGLHRVLEAAASSRLVSRTVREMRPGSAVGPSPGCAGGIARVPVRSLSWAAVTAQIARAAMTRTMCGRIAA